MEIFFGLCTWVTKKLSRPISLEPGQIKWMWWFYQTSASVSSDDSATSIWRPKQKNTHINPVLAQISRSVSNSPNQDGHDLDDCEESSDKGVSVASGRHHFAGSYSAIWLHMTYYVLILYKSIESIHSLCIDCGHDKNGRQCRNSEGLNEDQNRVITRRNKSITAGLNSPVNYLKNSMGKAWHWWLHRSDWGDQWLLPENVDDW